jgi:hypothetical protein
MIKIKEKMKRNILVTLFILGQSLLEVQQKTVTARMPSYSFHIYKPSVDPRTHHSNSGILGVKS